MCRDCGVAMGEGQKGPERLAEGLDKVLQGHFHRGPDKKPQSYQITFVKAEMRCCNGAKATNNRA